MITIHKDKLSETDVTGVVHYKHDGDSIHLFTLDDDEGMRKYMEDKKRHASSLIVLAANNEIKKIENDKSHKRIRDAVLAGIGHRGKNKTETKAMFRANIEARDAIEDRMELKLSEIAKASTPDELEAI